MHDTSGIQRPDQKKRRDRAKRKAKAARLERWNGVPITLSKHKVLYLTRNVSMPEAANAAPKFRIVETGRFLRTIVIKAGQRITQMIPILKREKVEESV